MKNIFYFILVISIMFGCKKSKEDNTNNPQPPSIPTNPVPSDTSTNVPVSTTLLWNQCTDPNGDPITYDIYLDTISNNPKLVHTSLSLPLFQANNLKKNATYYWRIVAKDNHNDSTTGPIWHFKTIKNDTSNQFPSIPKNPNPANGAINVSHRLVLSWTACTDPFGGAISYDIYFYTVSNTPILVATNHLTNSYEINYLNLDSTYYWQVVAKGSHNFTKGPEWHFATKAPVFGTYTDVRDGHVYKTTTIWDQTWISENISFTTSITNSWKHPNNNPANDSIYGKLYTKAGAIAAVPDGWHIPTLAEWDTLISSLSSSFLMGAGGKMKEIGINYWSDPNVGANNISGFNGRGAGWFDPNGSEWNFKDWAAFWYSDTNNSAKGLKSSDGEVYDVFVYVGVPYYSLRCVKN